MAERTKTPIALDRDEVLRRVRRGEMSHEDADQWAANHNEVFSCKPDATRFNPAQEHEWTLPMVAAWIVDRSFQAVRSQWDLYRREILGWEPCLFPIKPGAPLGRELKPTGPAQLFSIFYDKFTADLHAAVYDDLSDKGQLTPRYNEGAEVAARELRFALSTGQLQASGVREGERAPIPATGWRGPVARHQDRLASDALYATDGDDRIYREVRVARDEVLAIWTPLIECETARVGEPVSIVQPAPTLPTGFERPDWSVEHVLAWLAVRNIKRLRVLELPDPSRPKWYARLHRHGYDDTAESALRDALVCEKLVARSEERGIVPGNWWRARELLSVGEDIWFRRREVVDLWREQNSENAQPTDESRSSEIAMTDSAQEARKRVRPVVKPPHEARRRGRRPILLDRVVVEMAREIANGELTRNDLKDKTEKWMADHYSCSRTTARTARDMVLEERPRQAVPRDHGK